LEGKLGTALAKALVDGASYDWESTAAIDCSPRPSVVVVFSGDDRGEYTDRVAVYFCFSCDRIDVQFRTPVFGSEALFHPARTRFVKLVKQMFPEDRFVEELHEVDPAEPGSTERNAVPE
jgi:hypothetical protein